MNFERLLEKTWGDLKHLETERHWFLGAYAVLVAGSAAFLAQFDKSNASGISPVHVYFVLILVSLLGLLHALRIAWMLHHLQNDIVKIAREWQDRTDPHSWDILGFWSFRREEPSEEIHALGPRWAVAYGVNPLFLRSHGRWHLWKIPLPSGFRFPNLAALHVWVYWWGLGYSSSCLSVVNFGPG